VNPPVESDGEKVEDHDEKSQVFAPAAVEDASAQPQTPARLIRVVLEQGETCKRDGRSKRKQAADGTLSLASV
jgi:hypothetical protein